MPDLSHEASLAYWNSYPDPSIYKVIVYLESVENFCNDDEPTLNEALIRLGHELDNISGIDMSMLDHEETFIKLAANIKTSRGLRLLQAIDQAHPGSASRVLVHAEENSMDPEDASSIFLKRNIAFEKLRLLGRVFCEYRLELVAKALEGDD